MICCRSRPSLCVLFIVAGELVAGMCQGLYAEDLDHAKYLAERAALSVLANDPGLILREEWWKGTLEPGKARLFPQQLFSRNIYQFWLAVPDPSASVLLNLYDGAGKLIVTRAVDSSGAKNVASIVVTPEKTGTYYLRLALEKGAEVPQDWALIYAFK